MSEKRITIEIFDHKDIDKIPIKQGLWRHAFVRDEDGKVVLAEIINISKGNKAWCYACTDIIDKEQFDRITKEDPEYYSSKTFEEYKNWALKGCFKIEKRPKEKIVKSASKKKVKK